MPIKVLHISSNGELGGREKMLFQLARLEHKDSDLSIAVMLKNPVGFFYEMMVELKIPTVPMITGSFLPRLLRQAQYFSEFDILVCHFANLEIFLALWLSGKPILYRLSGVYLLTKKSVFQAVLAFFKKKKSKKKEYSAEHKTALSVENSTPNYRSVQRLFRRWYFICFLRFICDKIIVNSHYCGHSAIKFYGVDPRKIRVIYNGVVPAVPGNREVLRKVNAIADDDFLIGVIARFDVRKRLDRLLEGFLKLSEYKKFKLIIVGGGDDHLQRQFQSWINSHGLTDRVFLAGYREDIGNVLSALELFVLPSDNEAFGLSLVEAMMNGVPVIAFADSGGPFEILQQTRGGFIITTPEEIAVIARELFDDPQKRQRLGAMAREDSKKNFSFERFHHEVKDSYFKLLG